MVATRTLTDALGASAKTASAPAIIRGSVDLSTYPGVALGALADSAARQANGTALQAGLDYCNTNGKYCEVPPGRYEYEATATQNSRNVGLQVKKDVPGFIGAGGHTSAGTLFVQFANNHPALTLGDIGATTSDLTEGAVYGGFVCGHGASQAGQTSADGLLLGRIWRSTFDDIYISPFLGASTYHAYVGLRIGLSTSQFFFSNRIGTVTIKSGQLNFFRQVANGTGNKWANLYMGTGTFGNRVSLSGNAMWVELSGLEFGDVDQLNIEWSSLGSGLGALRSDAVAMVIGHLHLEGNQLNGFDPYLVHAVAGAIKIHSMRGLDNWIASANASGNPRIFSAYSDARIKADQVALKWNGSGYNTEAVASMAFRLYHDDTTVVGRQPHIEVGYLDVAGNTGAMNLDANLSGAAPGAAGAIYSARRYVFNKTRSWTEGAVIECRNADITIYAAHRSPQPRLKQALTADRKCIISDNMASSGIGNVSTRPAGEIINPVRESGATGAFNWNVRNSADDTTIVQLTTANTEGSAVRASDGTWDAS